VSEAASVSASFSGLLQRRAAPYVAVGLAVLGWSASALFVRASHAPAVPYTTWRLWFALPPLYALVAWRSVRAPGTSLLTIPGRNRFALVGATALAGVLFAAAAGTAFAAIGNTTLLDATLIPALQPIVVMVIAVLFLHEKVRRGLVARCAIAVAGTALVASAASGRGSWSLYGDMIAVVSLFANSLWHVYGRFIRHRFGVDPIVFMAGALTSAALVMTPVALLGQDGLHIGPHAIGYAALTMISGTTAHVAMVWAHGYVPASVSAPATLAEPAIVSAAGWVAFGDAPGPVEVVGGLIVMGALVGIVRSEVTASIEDEEVTEPSL
jgi:drug/metabolite transporter (DMT)-like permease